MLYLEDYVEMIEHLPQELRDRFTEMREMDLGVQNNMDTLEKRVRLLFGSCRRNEITTDQANTEFNDIRKGYNRTLEEADEKVNLANQMYELVERYLRRLDTEIYKIKCELEADNKGITEVLEKRSLELDMPVPVNPVSSGSYKDSRYRQKAEKRRDSWAGVGGPLTIGGRASAEGRTLLAATAPLALSRTESAIQAALSRGLSEAQAGISSGSSAIGLGHLAAGTAIAAAASQAIVATQHMQQGRRTASLKASYEAISAAAAAAANSAGLNISSTSMGGSSPALGGTLLHTSTQREPHHTITHHTAAGHHSSNHHSSGHHSSSHHGGSSASANKRHKKKTTSSSYSTTVGNISNLAQNLSGTPTASRSSSPSLGASSSSAAVASASLPAMNVEEQLTDGEWSFDPNEPRYCICNQVSYGDMVACDNEDCPFEWFHYPCVGVTAPPKGKWYCPQCNVNVRRNRGNRKN